MLRHTYMSWIYYYQSVYDVKSRVFLGLTFDTTVGIQLKFNENHEKDVINSWLLFWEDFVIFVSVINDLISELI